MGDGVTEESTEDAGHVLVSISTDNAGGFWSGVSSSDIFRLEVCILL